MEQICNKGPHIQLQLDFIHDDILSISAFVLSASVDHQKIDLSIVGIGIGRRKQLAVANQLLEISDAQQKERWSKDRLADEPLSRLMNAPLRHQEYVAVHSVEPCR